ncbi:Non-lysosomal glucosylceramidase [Fasciola gigantica]|uniref:Non-lysosomal glucosylceramidase n=1 Tax=Fasciola gigantica TaxID=46835 RepID=A0A504YWJ9_FASGI|nr:Non-lysosomal glucosylceramidase [Fasciola gigantica]
MDVESDETVHELLERLKMIPQYGWKVRFDHQPEFTCRPFTIPRLSQIRDIVSMAVRYTFNYYIRKRFLERRLPFLDPSRHVSWSPIYGVPMGGIGSGALGRGFRGEFVRSSLIPGIYSYEPQPADQGGIIQRFAHRPNKLKTRKIFEFAMTISVE